VPLQSRCLRSSEYYALLGAAQLNAGALDLAAEALERALLLDADNGAAQIDYAEVLLRQGQLFPALQLNAVLEAREDLPEELRQSVVQRGTQWRGLTKQNSVQLDASGRLRQQSQWRTRFRPAHAHLIRRARGIEPDRRLSAGRGRV
jgi:tetratricopeptide (TPR) repeat protein